MLRLSLFHENLINAYDHIFYFVTVTVQHYLSCFRSISFYRGLKTLCAIIVCFSPVSAKACTLFSSEASFIRHLVIHAINHINDDLCFLFIICSDIAKSFFNDAALDDRFRAFKMGECTFKA